MATDLTSPRSTGQPSILSPKPLRDLIGRVRSAVDRGQDGRYWIERSVAPSVGEMAEIDRRAEELRAVTAPAPAETVERRIAKLFLLFSTAGLSGDTGEAVTRAYAGVLKQFPLWAIDRACQRIIASGATFRPSAPELRKLVVAECGPAYEEVDAIRMILSATVYDAPAATERDRVKAAFANLIASFDTSKRGRQTREQAERDVEAGFAHLQGPVRLGDTLNATVEPGG